MRRLAVVLGVAAAAVAGIARWPHKPAEMAAPVEQPRVLASAEIAAAPTTEATADSPANRRLDELRTMSETVRNSTFVIAIRAAGFMCEDIVDVYAGADVPTWRARCRDSRAYYVRVADTGSLAVEPTLDYFDGVGAPRVVEFGDRNRPDRTIVPLEPRR